MRPTLGTLPLAFLPTAEDNAVPPIGELRKLFDYDGSREVSVQSKADREGGRC